MPTDIDKLQIEIIANVNKADNAIDNFIGRLDKLTVSLGKVGNTNITGFSNSIKTMSDGMKNFSSVKMPDFNRTAKGIEKFGEINSSNISKVGISLKPLAEGVNLLSSTSFDNKSLQNLINSITRLSNANVGSLNSVNFSGIGNSINTLANSLANAPKIQQSVISMTNAVAHLSKSGQNIPIVTSSLGQLGTSLRAFMKNMSNAPTISADTIMFSQAIATLANAGAKTGTTASNLDALAISLKNFMKTMSTAPAVNNNIIQMTNALANLASQGGKVGRASNSIVRGLNSASASANKAKKSFSGLAGVIGKFYATYWLLFRSLSKLGEAIDVSSALTEVQNVVDVTFGEYASLVEKMSETSITDFGMSELTVKQVSSRFQAMGSAMGFAQGKMADMSIELTKLTADMASFYNVEQKDVAEDLESIFTGQTRPLRTYGLDLTEATLKEWAMKQGMDANIDSMSQMEKTMSRYNYVMANTGAAQGDFLRTQDTWANQVRILKQQLEQLAIVVGKTLINALKPLVKALNNAMTHIIPFATTVSNALGKIFGWKYEVGSGGVTSDMEDASEGADGISDGLSNANKEAKKLKTHLLGIDELNVYDPTDSTSGTSGGGVGASATGEATDDSKWVKQDSIFDNYESQLDTLYKLGDYISQTLSRAMESIDWDSVYKKAENFGSGLANFLNGLISPRLFGNLGKTIANSLNTALTFLNTFGTTFDWNEFGESIASGIHNFFSNWDAGLAGETLSTFANGFIETITEGILGIIDNETFKTIGEKIVEFICNIDWGGLAWNLTKLWNALKEALLELPMDLAEGMVQGIVDQIFGENSFKFEVPPALKDLWGILSGIFLSGPLTSIPKSIEFIKKIFSPLATWFNNKVITPLKTAWDTGITAISGFFINLWSGIKTVWTTVSGWFNEYVIEPVAGFFGGFYSRVKQIFEGLWIVVKAVWIKVSGWFNEYVVAPVVTVFDFLKEKVGGLFASLWSGIKNIWDKVSGWFSDYVINPVISVFSPIVSKIKGFFSSIWSGIKAVWIKVSGWFSDYVITPLQTAWQTATGAIGGFFSSLWSGIKSGVVGAMNAVIGGVESGINFIVNGINAIIGGFNKIVSWAAKVAEVEWGGVELIPRVSLSRIPQYEIGGFPEDGLFFANHNELVGQFSNGRTAVANNEQIIAGIEGGVERAVEKALLPYLAYLPEIAKSTRETANKDLSVNIGDRDIARANKRGMKSMGYALVT